MMLTQIKLIGDTETEYTISIDPVTKAARCSCPAYRYATEIKLCKHIKYVAELVS